ncbi:hypothetical protein [Bacillus sp. EB01]|uniref:hypothetical protein n=1 Tax=Bacillus sp. EB01 TaxID=1347086 RepID=UPI0005C6A0E9|nr:hypothetical protein [Bacillus sp. EB01]
MDDRFNRLKESMDNTVLKNLDFRERNKAQVRNAIYNPNKSKSFKSVFPLIISLSFTCIFIVGISYFSLEKSGVIQEGGQASGVGGEKEVQQKNEPSNEKIKPASKSEENYDAMEKEDVLNKLLNTVDNFQTASGKYEIFDRYYDESTSQRIVEFKTSLSDPIGGYEKALNLPDKKVKGAKLTTNELFYNDQKIWSLNDDSKTYSSNDYAIEPKREVVKPEDVFSIPIYKLYDSSDKFRERPPSGSSGLLLFPYEMTVKYLRFTDQWKIEKQNEELFGHNTIVLHGSVDKSVVNRVQPNESSFRFWVDKDTGILVQYEIYNDKGEVISYLRSETLEVNIPIDPQQFVPKLDNFTSANPGPASNIDPEETEIEVIEHADTIPEHVGAVLEILHKETPFIYEFSTSQLKIHSASLERYKQFNHAYLTYEEPGSSVVYVRAYHKDSTVRSNWVYNWEKGKELDQFNLNGIEWRVFEVKDNPDHYLIGSKGDFTYEMIFQGDSNLQEISELLKSFKESGSRH